MDCSLRVILEQNLVQIYPSFVSRDSSGSTHLTTGRQMAGLVKFNHDEQLPRELLKSSRTSVRLFSSTLFCHSFSSTPPKPNPAPSPLLSPSGGLVRMINQLINFSPCRAGLKRHPTIIAANSPERKKLKRNPLAKRSHR